MVVNTYNSIIINTVVKHHSTLFDKIIAGIITGNKSTQKLQGLKFVTEFYYLDLVILVFNFVIIL